jgi:lysophospholipase L1-like esterase
MPDKELLFGDIMHMNQEGYEKLASLVYRVILDRKIIEKRGC